MELAALGRLIGVGWVLARSDALLPRELRDIYPAPVALASRLLGLVHGAEARRGDEPDVAGGGGGSGVGDGESGGGATAKTFASPLAPGLGFQFGVGGIDAFRSLGGEGASSAT